MHRTGCRCNLHWLTCCKGFRACEDCWDSGKVVQRSNLTISTEPDQYMEKGEVIGLYKILSKDEEIIFEGSTLTPILQVKEAYIKKVLNREERREIPLALYEGKLYLTTKRMIFLILHQTFSQDYGGDNKGVVGSWTEIPVEAIKDYQIRPVIVKDSMWKGFLDVIEEIVAVRQGRIEAALEVVYDEKRASGRSLEYAEGLMGRGRIAKKFGKVKRISDKLLILGNDAVSISPSLKQFTIKKIKSAAAAEGDFFCNKCGTKQPESNSRFCSKCGNPLQPPIESTT